MHNVNIFYTLDHEKATKRNGPSPGKDDGHIGGQLIDISQAMLTADNLSVTITPLIGKRSSESKKPCYRTNHSHVPLIFQSLVLCAHHKANVLTIRLSSLPFIQQNDDTTKSQNPKKKEANNSLLDL